MICECFARYPSPGRFGLGRLRSKKFKVVIATMFNFGAIKYFVPMFSRANTSPQQTARSVSSEGKLLPTLCKKKFKGRRSSKRFSACRFDVDLPRRIVMFHNSDCGCSFEAFTLRSSYLFLLPSLPSGNTTCSTLATGNAW